MSLKKHSVYLEICIGYRIITLLLSSAVYLAMSLYYEQSKLRWEILLGMTISCLISTWIYFKIESNSFWLRIMFSLEILAYGIFTILSGGLSSPYLWYQLSSILLLVALEKKLVITFFASVWCLICAFIGKWEQTLCYQELNIALAMIIIIGGFYILRFHIYYIEKQKEQLLTLNLNLEKEKARNEYAFLQLAELYETFHLFAMTNPDKIIHDLTLILHRALAPSGCILIKLDTNGNLERIEPIKISEDILTILEKEIRALIDSDQLRDISSSTIVIEAKNELYECVLLGDIITYKGIFIRKDSNLKQENEGFYWKLIEIIFSNLDSHSQMEHFIAMEEKNRIASEIHDTVIQKLFGMVCKLKVLETQSACIDVEELKEQLNLLKKSVELTMTELRESIYGHSFNDTIHTFSGALELYMKEAQNLNGVNIELHLDASADNMTSAQKIAMYRIACEAVNNAIRHGSAGCISITLQMDTEQICLQVEDNGIGLPKTGSAAANEGNGVKNMHNIATLLKGSLLIESDLGKGTKVTCILPR